MRFKISMALMTLCAPAFAQDLASCSSTAEAARNIMQARQNGVPLQTIINAGDQLDEQLHASMNAIAIEAYKEPLFSTEEYKKSAVTEFENKILVICLEN